jgi:tetratricopeptide (TPR) repeat protein
MDLMFILFIAGLILYFIPTFIAQGKEEYSKVAIVNIFLGWTLLGWVLALVWAVGGKKVEKKTYNPLLLEYQKKAKKHLKKGEIEEAFSNYESALLIDPKNNPLLVECARIKAMQSDLKEAYKYIALAANNGWDNFAYLQTNTSFKNLTSDSNFKPFALSGYTVVPENLQ